MFRLVASAGICLCLLAVAMGAYVSHGAAVSAAQQQSLEVAVRYQMWHGLALIGLALMPLSQRWANALAASFVVAISLFSGSIYGLILANWKAIWWMTPLGGSLLILTWAALLVGCWKGQRT
ncbi:DUF423 domain-containing protein [Neiella sp. HB171785]|uniref:DUF423 domain-containing protein n=1 Tax=Neiella litorisoli TaxID=2771431 RepID=A0A8J6UM20_9GAMM|nr:DUF423 domain-containing protein [Neiella litorisoli]MBD1389730.1 DUF423 domain-containing protein [Neiella litorisoli]